MNSDLETQVNRELLLFAVQRKIFCDTTNRVLDIRDAVLITGEKDGATVVNLCVTGEAYDNGREAVEATAEKIGVELEIIDGREF